MSGRKQNAREERFFFLDLGRTGLFFFFFNGGGDQYKYVYFFTPENFCFLELGGTMAPAGPPLPPSLGVIMKIQLIIIRKRQIYIFFKIQINC
jgi:hypothetical protein